MKKEASMSANKTIQEELNQIIELGHGTCGAIVLSRCVPLILCFAWAKKFQNGTYCPDPSDKYCHYYDSIWSAMVQTWHAFETATAPAVYQHIQNIQDSGASKSDFAKFFKKYLHSTSRLGEEIFCQPEQITELAAKILDYKGGTVYNPYAGVASYGCSLKIGQNYSGDEINQEIWAIGMMNLLLNNSVSDHFICHDSSILNGKRYNYVISTPPFGVAIKGRNCSLDEMLLSKADELLEENGTMVSVAVASFASKTGQPLAIRKDLIERNLVDTVIALPKEAFAPKTQAYTLLIVLKKGRKSDKITFLDARKCTTTSNTANSSKQDKRVLNTPEILGHLHDNNYAITVSCDEVREKGYELHPAKYEEQYLAKLDDGFNYIHLRQLIVPTGVSDYIDGGRKIITVSDLSSDPFNFKKDVFDIKERMDSVSGNPVDFPSLQRLNNFEEQRKVLENMRNDVANTISSVKQEIDMCMVILTPETQERYERLLSSRKEEIEQRSKYLESEIRYTENQLSQVSNHKTSFADKIFGTFEPFEKEELLDKREYLETELKKLKRELEQLEEHIRVELGISTLMNDRKKNVLQHRLDSLYVRKDKIDSDIAETDKRLAEIREEIHKKSKKITKIVHPALILGGTKPKLKFLYVNASPTNPVYLGSSHCFAFKVDTTAVDLDFLAYQISNLTFPEYGEIIPMVKREEILNATIPITSLDRQKEFVETKRNEADPYRKELQEIKEQLAKQESAFIATLNYKQHEMGHYMYNISGCFNKIYRLISRDNGASSKDEVIRQMEFIEDYIVGVNAILEHLNDKDLFAPGVPVNIRSFFNEYVANQHANNYIIRYEEDKYLMSQEGFSPVILSSKEALTSVLHNIRQNAESHGFADNPNRTDYEIAIKVFIDEDRGLLNIDFVNNGTPFIKGNSDEIDEMYASPEGKAGNHAHTGRGGAYVAEMAKFYNGACHVNPDGWDPDFTTIRLTFPIYYE